MKFREVLNQELKLQQLKAVREIAAASRQPKGRYQRQPDGTWGYSPLPQPEDATAAFERGWRAGWEAGYKAAKTPELV